jgi:hypothetical protein
MPCVRVPQSDGSVAILCGPRRGAPRPTCSVCGVRPGTQQCDGEPTSMQRQAGLASCSVWLCKGCAWHVPPDVDYCPAHQAGHPRPPLLRQMGLFVEG